MKPGKTQRKRSEKRRAILLVLLFLAGLFFFLYPTLSDLYYRQEQKMQTTGFRTKRGTLSEEEVAERMRLAQGYNDRLNNVVTDDPYSKQSQEEGVAAYARMLEVEEKIGVIRYPLLHIELPIYAGTSEDVLARAAGHLEGTSLPIGGNSTHAVLTAHSGLPKARLFTDLHQAKVGDTFYIDNVKETLAYQVDQIHTVDPEDFSELLLVPGHDYVTLLTCTPVGVNSHRLLVRGHRIEYVEAVEETLLAESTEDFHYRLLFYAALVGNGVLLLLLLLLLRQRRRARKAEKEADDA